MKASQLVSGTNLISLMPIKEASDVSAVEESYIKEIIEKVTTDI